MLSSLIPCWPKTPCSPTSGRSSTRSSSLFGWILAGIYSVIPNYAVAITGLTILIMLALTPVTVKSTKSMIAMQRLQPEMKKLQAKYKGAENRETLNEEMMKLYKENGTSPFGACLPSLLADALPDRPVLADPRAVHMWRRSPRVGQVITARRPGTSMPHEDLADLSMISMASKRSKCTRWFGMDLVVRRRSRHHGA